MPSKQMHLRSPRMEDLRNQQAELSVSKHRHAIAILDSHLIENLAGCRDRLDKNRMRGWNCFRHAMQIGDRKRQELAKCARVLYDSEHTSMGAMAPQTPRAPVAFSAGEIDFAGDPLTD